MKLIRILAVLAVLMLVAPAATGSASAKGAKYDAVKQFSSKKNPNGPWSYLVSGSPLTQIAKGCFFGKVKKFSCWWNGQSTPNGAVVGANKSANTYQAETIVVPPDYFRLDPQSNQNVGVQWTAPSAGTYTITGNFLGIDTNQLSHPVEVDYNGTPIYTNTIASYGQEDTFSLTQTVAAGDTIALLSDTGSSYNDLSTGLQATIQG